MLISQDTKLAMTKKNILLALLISAAAASLCFAAGDDAFMGTWKLNESKSKIPEGAPKNTTVVYEQDGDEVTITVEPVKNGRPIGRILRAVLANGRTLGDPPAERALPSAGAAPQP